EQNYPNPFNPSTVISYQLPVSSLVQIKVYNVLGQEIATLVNEEKPAGTHNVKFNASNLSSGIYFYRIEAGKFVETKKMVILK
ncbi:MAG: T9SS type A sorting domain-containing protein, partial [Ignavibacteriales bacterium]|nr:T9SS type A sorting domain-containing protein [Ignavibacteriales bacterium]